MILVWLQCGTAPIQHQGLIELAVNLASKSDEVAVVHVGAAHPHGDLALPPGVQSLSLIAAPLTNNNPRSCGLAVGTLARKLGATLILAPAFATDSEGLDLGPAAAALAFDATFVALADTITVGTPPQVAFCHGGRKYQMPLLGRAVITIPLFPDPSPRPAWQPRPPEQVTLSDLKLDPATLGLPEELMGFELVV